MAKRNIHLQRIKDVEELARKTELVVRQLEEQIEALKVRVTSAEGDTPPKVKPKQQWYNSTDDQLYFRRPDGTDKLIG